MSSGPPPAAARSSTPNCARSRKRVLIEASKLADLPMDGIRRYVVELLREFSAAGVGDHLEVDVMILDRVYPLAEVPAFYFGSEGPPEVGEAITEKATTTGGVDRILRAFGALIPPIVLIPIRWFIPAWASRRFMGKEKSELRVPKLTLDRANIISNLLPPILARLLDIALPSQVTQALWALGIMRPPPMAVELGDYDLIHLTLPNNHHYLPPSRIPMLVTVHDLCHIVCPQFQTRDSAHTLRMGLNAAIEDGARFVAVSDATRTEMIRAYGLDPRRVTTLLSGCDERRFSPVHDQSVLAAARRKYGIPEGRFLLTLCTIEPRKNLEGTLEAFELLVEEFQESSVVLVIAGADGWKSGKFLRSAAGSSARVRLIGHVEEEDLTAVYSAATGFVYASHYEGFGFPLLEAMRCGTPVIYGNNSSMPELVGDAGLAVDAEDPRDIARQLHRLLSDEELAYTLRQRAVDRANRFSWVRCAADTLNFYEEVLRGS